MPRPNAGWTDSSLELVKIRLLDKTQELHEEGMALEVNTAFLGEITDNKRLLNAAAKGLAAEGLAKTEEGLAGGLGLFIAPAGEALVQTRSEQRKNPRLRAAACREALLDWCYIAGVDVSLREFAGDVRAHFEGEPFSQDEREAAARDLREKGLITGKGTLQNQILRVGITAVGKSVVEDHDSSVKAYESQGRSPASVTTIHIEGSTFSGQLTVGDANQITQNNEGAGSEFVDLLQAVLTAASQTNEDERVAKLVAQLQLEAEEEEPDSTFVGKTLDRIQDTAAKTGSGALVDAVGRLLQYIHDHGIPQMLGAG